MINIELSIAWNIWIEAMLCFVGVGEAIVITVISLPDLEFFIAKGGVIVRVLGCQENRPTHLGQENTDRSQLNRIFRRKIDVQPVASCHVFHHPIGATRLHSNCYGLTDDDIFAVENHLDIYNVLGGIVIERYFSLST